MFKQTETYKGQVYDAKHGSPFDRGSADAYYRRMRSPHYYKEGTRVDSINMSDEQRKAYYAGYSWQIDTDEFKGF